MNTIHWQNLNSGLESLKEQYRTAQPVPHVVIDNFFNINKLKQIHLQIPNPNDMTLWNYDNPLEKKKTFDSQEDMPHDLSYLIYELNGGKFLKWLGQLVGEPGLVADHGLRGGGLHFSGKGSYLHIHKDFNLHPGLKLLRKINIIAYLNPVWQNSWGGALELWNADMTQCVKSVEPTFGRVVIFDTTDAWHGHPDPLTCPESIFRTSLALYYYQSTYGMGEIKPRSTLYHKRPFDKDDPELEALREKRAKGRLT